MVHTGAHLHAWRLASRVSCCRALPLLTWHTTPCVPRASIHSIPSAGSPLSHSPPVGLLFILQNLFWMALAASLARPSHCSRCTTCPVGLTPLLGWELFKGAIWLLHPQPPLTNTEASPGQWTRLAQEDGDGPLVGLEEARGDREGRRGSWAVCQLLEEQEIWRPLAKPRLVTKRNTLDEFHRQLLH